jgi:uncharacterized membrane protein
MTHRLGAGGSFALTAQSESGRHGFDTARSYDLSMRVFYSYGGPLWIGWIIWPLALAAIIVTVVLVARSSRRGAVYQRPWSGGGPWQGHWQGGWQSPGLHELDIRYARGEITRDEYLQRRSDMLSHPWAPPPGGPPPGASGPSSPA